MDRALMRIKEVLENEIDAIAEKKDISPTELERLDKAVDIIKDIETICAMKEYSYEDESLSYMRDGGASYRRGRNADTGRYMSRESGYSEMYPTYGYDWRPSYNRGGYGGVSYAGGTDYMNRMEVKDSLKRMMANASSEKERMAIQQFLENWKE